MLLVAAVVVVVVAAAVVVFVVALYTGYVQATQRAVLDVVYNVLQDPHVHKQVLSLLWRLYEDQKTIDLTGQFLLYALQTPMFLEGR